MSELEIPRDRWGRPLITPVGGGKPEPYTRVSTLAKTLDDKTALSKWMCRQTAIGLARTIRKQSVMRSSRLWWLRNRARPRTSALRCTR